MEAAEISFWLQIPGATESEQTEIGLLVSEGVECDVRMKRGQIECRQLTWTIRQIKVTHLENTKQKVM